MYVHGMIVIYSVRSWSVQIGTRPLWVSYGISVRSGLLASWSSTSARLQLLAWRRTFGP